MAMLTCASLSRFRHVWLTKSPLGASNRWGIVVVSPLGSYLCPLELAIVQNCLIALCGPF